MKSFIQNRLLWILLLLPLLSQAKDYDEGIEYTQLEKAISTQTGDKIEVLEFFWYGCPHCFAFEPTIKKWKKTLPANVKFIRVPSPINPSWMVHTKAYYTLQIMGEGDKQHDAIFQALHIDKKKIYSKEAIADFLATRGVNKGKFLANFDSFAVEMRARQALQLGQQYNINGVPALAVNGKYTISGTQAGSHQGMVDVADFLIKKESK
ncbi:MAG TPA: thiol:disulfide interchange protein DsbA/DsbL [Gammaproteobacteria bacterium]|nr:thiol:disulfide interchange protein DsbA/DsbL [Gammaproteobacteria bacterium]